MVGIVIVSHSAALAQGVAELAREMGGPEVAIEVAGGLDEPGRPLGTDANLVLQAIERADAGDGVVVLMDLGSAVLSAEMALDMLEDGRKGTVRLCGAPVVEGAVSAAAAARQGLSLDEVAAEADRGLRPKQEHLGGGSEPPEQSAGDVAEGGQEVRLLVTNPLGLHARPAARLVATAARFDARISVANATAGRGPANARSLSAVATLGVRQGHEIVVRANGPEARRALDSLRDLAERGFGDEEPESAAPAPLTPLRHEPDSRGRLTGAAASPGIALGRARLYRPAEPVVEELGGEPADEWSELTSALEAARAELADTRATVAGRMGEEAAGILDAQMLLLADDELLASARREIFDEERSAGRAFGDAAESVARAYEGLEDTYQRARAGDVRDVRRRVLRHLGGATAPALELDEGVVVAEDLAPADVGALDPDRVLAVATARGGPTSHAAILARAAGIPAAVGLGAAILEVVDDTLLLVDGSEGVVFVNPAPDVVARYEERKKADSERERVARAAASEPACTRDGSAIEVMANAGSVQDALRAAQAGADGIGLLRTEFVFLGRARAPSEDEQFEAYAGVARALRGKPVLLRTLDAGGDKPLPWLRQPAEANPFLGVRGLRLSLDLPDLLRTQLRAAARAAVEGSLKVMFPMVTTTSELKRARLLADEAADGLVRPEIGIMVEVPAAALAADRFASEVDFFSVGTNDLAQYTMAAERGNERVASLGDPLHPAVLRLVGLVCEAAAASGTRVGVCGEVAADPVAAPVLIGLGVRELSMSVRAVAGIKQVVRTLDLPGARAVADEALAASSAAEVRALGAAELERVKGAP